MVLLDANPLPLTRASQCVNETIDTTALYSKKSKRQRRKNVTFSANLCIISARHVSYSEEEKQTCFYNKKDRRTFEDDRVRVCQEFQRMFRKGEVWKETETMTLRGLEDFFGRYSKDELRKLHAYKVLTEQQRQRRLGEDIDEDTIRYVSSESSGEGRSKAIEIAKRDELAAQKAT